MLNSISFCAPPSAVALCTAGGNASIISGTALDDVIAVQPKDDGVAKVDATDDRTGIVANGHTMDGPLQRLINKGLHL